MSLLNEFLSKKKGHALQPQEISLMADIIIIFYAVKGRMPSKAEIKTLWSDYNE
jgi:hypothetical protein